MAVSQRRNNNHKNGTASEELPLTYGDTDDARKMPKKQKKKKIQSKPMNLNLCVKLIGYALLSVVVLVGLIFKTGKQEEMKQKVLDIKNKVTGNTANYVTLTIVQKLFHDAEPALDGTHVVFLTVSNLNRTFVGRGLSKKSPHDALKQAQAKVPRKTNKFPYAKIDIVTGVRRINNFNYFEDLRDLPSDWFGLALDWETDYIFLPDETRGNSLVDDNNYIRWERIALYAAKHKLKGGQFAVPDLADDTTTLDHVDLFHTDSILLDYENHKHVELYNGHRLFPKISKGMVQKHAKEAGGYLSRTIKEDGRMVYKYNPRSDFEPFGYNLERHAGTIYAMATLYGHSKEATLKDKIKSAIEYLMKSVQECPLPYSPTQKAKCVVDLEGIEGDKISKLGSNTMAVIAIIEYIHLVQPSNAVSLLTVAKSISEFIQKSQRKNGSFVQKIMLDTDSNALLDLDEDFFVRYYQGQVTFALARFKSLAKQHSWMITESWIEVAHNATKYIVELDSDKDEKDFAMDHWIMYGIAELQSAGHVVPDEFIDFAMKSVKVTAKFQNVVAPDNEEKDMVGIFYDDDSGVATATKAEGLCAAYSLAKFADQKTLIRDTIARAIQYQLQTQFQPETAMYMRKPSKVLGGFRSSVMHYDMRNDYVQHNLASLLCYLRTVDSKSGAKA